jgi:hypothetical protein
MIALAGRFLPHYSKANLALASSLGACAGQGVAALRAHLDASDEDANGAAVQQRIADVREWLLNNAASFDGQLLQDMQGARERTCWHYGYLQALLDMREIFFENGARKPPQS